MVPRLLVIDVVQDVRSPVCCPAIVHEQIPYVILGGCVVHLLHPSLQTAALLHGGEEGGGVSEPTLLNLACTRRSTTWPGKVFLQYAMPRTTTK